MQNQISESAESRVKPWTVLMLSNGKKRILKRFKNKLDADCYCNRLNQVATDNICYQVKLLFNTLPPKDNGN
ncbi:hypothetical protein RIVM261_013060 [Rivularia sp. IAM M-261]|nr:hypothetical protein RIVM261_013060 [Rivularia sp. IAM M-261]